LSSARLLQEKDAIKVGFYGLILIFFVFLFVVAIYLVSDILIGRTTREFNSGAVRLEMWQAGLRLAAQSPIWGYGQDMAAYVLGFRGSGGVITIDSYFLSVLLESGYPGLLAFFLIIVIPIWNGTLAGLSKGENSVAALTISAALIAFFLVKAILSLTHNHGLVLILIGLLGYILSTQEQSKAKIIQPHFDAIVR
jgi:O-antigen ligase